MTLAGIGLGCVMPATTKAVLVWFPIKERATAMGFKQTGVNVGGMISAASYCEAWTKVAGGLAKVSRPGLLKRGVLQITVNNSAAVQELTFQKRQLLRDLSEELPEQKICDLRFIVGAID